MRRVQWPEDGPKHPGKSIRRAKQAGLPAALSAQGLRLSNPTAMRIKAVEGSSSGARERELSPADGRLHSEGQHYELEIANSDEVSRVFFAGRFAIPGYGAQDP